MDFLYQGDGNMDWKSCQNNRLIKAVQKDEPLISSLQQGSEKKLKTNKLLPLTEVTAATKISIIYDALRELLEALALEKGYKVYNHECYCSFLREIMKEDVLAEEFDKWRKLRNSINYYGKEIYVEEAKIVLPEIEKLIEKVKKMF